MVLVGSKLLSRFYHPRRISETASRSEVIEIIANVTGGWAARDIGYFRCTENRIDLTLSHYFVASYPPGILEENNDVPLDVVGNWGVSSTTRRHVRPGNRWFDDVVTAIWLAVFTWDGDDKEVWRGKGFISVDSFLSLCWGSFANAAIVSPCWSLCLIVTSKKSISSGSRWYSNRWVLWWLHHSNPIEWAVCNPLQWGHWKHAYDAGSLVARLRMWWSDWLLRPLEVLGS